ncbi:cupin domain-containing protein [Castellaniella sp.]|uniref:cupin domain-containing protein n=1 Tax=Castellaniella sp. TaxID=1955812 RepID=UPI003565B6E3
MKRTQAVPTVHIDNEFTRVTRWTFPPGSETGWHRHELDYVVVPVITGILQIDTRDGQRTPSPLTAEQPYARAAGIEHNVINESDVEVAFIEIEIK